MLSRLFLAALLIPFGLQTPTGPDAAAEQARMDAQNAALRTLLASSPRMPLTNGAVAVKPRPDGWALGMVSWVASDATGLVYLLQRGDKADPVVVLNGAGEVVRSWGKGLYTMPHAIRVDPEGNIWTTDAASSMVYKFSPAGRLLMKIEVGGQPTPCGNFCSTTDVAFAADGHVFIADGYRNARILEYTADGQKVKEWGTAGSGPGQFRLPHSIQVGADDIVYVADRENGRVQRFDRSGAYLGEWTQYGKTFGLKLVGDALWLSTIPRGPNTAPGWMIKIDKVNGTVLGYVESQGNHGMEVMASGDLLLSPGPEQVPQRYGSR